MVKDGLISLYSFNLAYAKDLVSDVTEDHMSISPNRGLENHPAFTLGHLATASALVADRFGEEYNMDDYWDALFRRKGPGDPQLPGTEADLYPKKEELLQQLETCHLKVEKIIKHVSAAELKEDLHWRFSSFMPTKGEMLRFMCITHESMHLGQLASWRRAMGYPSSLGRL